MQYEGGSAQVRTAFQSSFLQGRDECEAPGSTCEMLPRAPKPQKASPCQTKRGHSLMTAMTQVDGVSTGAQHAAAHHSGAQSWHIITSCHWGRDLGLPSHPVSYDMCAVRSAVPRGAPFLCLGFLPWLQRATATTTNNSNQLAVNGHSKLINNG